ncbi:MAG: tetratricopeptide repeat protein [Polyangiaceae bacterium]|nr:tetratricopeptide repeat protein [Polyangiaceae bacterium]
MSTVRPPTASLESPSDPNVTARALDWIREELELAEPGLAQAVLLHELATLEELAGDESSAARDYLEAINSEPEFSEPLERLIAILSARGSNKNLAKLLDRLSEVADGPEERLRAALERAAYQLEQDQDPDAARALLEESADILAGDTTAWLMLETLAGRLGDEELRLQALAARQSACAPGEWKSLLSVDLARLRASRSEGDDAVATLQAALGDKNPATFLVLRALDQIAATLGNDAVLAQARELMAMSIQSAIDDSAAGDSLGVPVHMRTPAHAADVLYRASECHRRSGDAVKATNLLERAIAAAPDETVLARARIRLAQTTGDTETAAKLAQATLGRGATGALAAALWMKVAERAAEQGDGAAALDAVNQGLAAEPGSIPARALQLDLLFGSADPTALPAALEAAADYLATDDGRARFYLGAADAWARRARDVAGAKAALSQASMLGASPATVARVSRFLASVAESPAWYDEATRRLLATGASESEQLGLWFELVRSRLSRGERAAAQQTLDGLTTTPGGALLGRVLAAYVLALDEPASGVEPLVALADDEQRPDVARALRLAAALRADVANDSVRARSLLQALHDADASDVVAAVALAGSCRRDGDLGAAAATLAATALTTEDVDLAAALGLEAGIAFWHSGARDQAVECFQAAARQRPDASGALLSWALCAERPDSLAARREALAAAEGEDRRALQLERFALELGSDGDETNAAAALDDVTGSDELARAADLARVLWRSERASAELAADAVEALSLAGGACAALVRSAEHAARLAQEPTPDVTALLETAASWAAADGGVAASLELLSFATAAGDVPAELEARHMLASRLGGEAGSALGASAAIVASLTSAEPPALVRGDSSVLRLTNLELALPGADPNKRAAALLGAADCFGADHNALVSALAGYNLLAAGRLDDALAVFRSVAEAHPDELMGWEGLRAVGEATGDRALVAEASASLGDAVSDAARGAELWEQTALILIDELNDTGRGEFALSRAVERDVTRFVAFDRLFRLVRARKDDPRLLELISKRLEVAEDPEEIVKLFWERARVLRQSGDREGALAALENVTMLEPDHVGALALSGEICITAGQFDEAADRLARLSTLDEAPAKQRLMSGVAAVDIFENKLKQPERALQVLESIYQTGLSTLPVRERLARLAAKLGAWQRATTVLEQLMHERDTSESRIEAARLAMVIHRDRLQAPAGAGPAVEKLLEEAPEDGEALELVIQGVLPADRTRRALERGRAAIVGQLMSEPLDAERVDRLARIAASLDHPPLRQAALGALVALGEGSPEVDRELAVLDQRVARVPQIAIDAHAIPDLCDPADRGPIADLMRVLATLLVETIGPGLEAFGVTKKQRVDPKVGLPVRNEVVAWSGALGVGDFDLYVGGHDPEGVFAVPLEKPAIILGANVRAPLAAAHRSAVARELFALKRGTTLLRHRDATDVAALIVAACSVVGVGVPSPQYAMLGEFQRVLSKESRKLKKLISELAPHVAHAAQDPVVWVHAATASLDRLAAIAAGDVSYVLSDTSTTRGTLGASMEAQARAARLLAFVLSPTYLSLREMLGMGVR